MGRPLMPQVRGHEWGTRPETISKIVVEFCDRRRQEAHWDVDLDEIVFRSDFKTVRVCPLSLLFDEYKILQDKIDKIGGFRVTIKGWAVTATIGGLVAIATGKGFSPTVSSCAVDVLLLFFFLFEREQVELGWRFNKRVRDIEIQFDRRRRLVGKAVTFSTPNIARSLFSRKRVRHELIRSKFKNSSFEKSRIWVNREVRLAIKSEIWFYFILGFAAWLPKLMGVLPSVMPTPISINNVIQAPPQPVPPAADLRAAKLVKPKTIESRSRSKSQSQMQGPK